MAFLSQNKVWMFTEWSFHHHKQMPPTTNSHHSTNFHSIPQLTVPWSFVIMILFQVWQKGCKQCINLCSYSINGNQNHMIQIKFQNSLKLNAEKLTWPWYWNCLWHHSSLQLAWTALAWNPQGTDCKWWHEKAHSCPGEKSHCTSNTSYPTSTLCSRAFHFPTHSCSQGLHKLHQEKAVGKDLVGSHDVVGWDQSFHSSCAAHPFCPQELHIQSH